MFRLESEITGKTARYGTIKGPFETEGFVLGGNWDFEQGYFDKILSQEGGETFYLRIPIQVVDGILDEENAQIEFGTPLVIKHVVHTGIQEDMVQHPFMDESGMSSLWNQFQPPIDLDGNIKDNDKWIQLSNTAIDQIMKYL